MSRKPKIAAGTMVAGGAGAMGAGAAGYTSKDIEGAMSQAIKDCHAEGVTDPVKVQAAMMAARKRVTQGA